MDILRWAMAGKKGQKKRVWSDDEKVSICTQARVAGVSVAQVARRYAMNVILPCECLSALTTCINTRHTACISLCVSLRLGPSRKLRNDLGAGGLQV